MRRRLPGVARRLERPAVEGDDVARVEDGLGYPQLNERQLARRSLLARWARWPRWAHRPDYPFSLQLHVVFGHEGDRELIFGGDPFPDALIDLSQRGRHNALARLRLFALGSHTPPSILGLLRRDPESA